MSGENQNSGLCVRELSPGEIARVVEAARRATRTDEPAPKLAHTVGVGAFAGDRSAGLITAERAWCVSNFWLEVSRRGLGAAGEMAGRIQALNTEGLAEFLITTNPHVERLAHSMGFVPLSGRLWRR